MSLYDRPSIDPSTALRAGDMRSSEHYREGFDDGLAGHPLHLGEPTAYVEGWLAAQECLALLEHGTIGTVRQEWHAWSGGA